MFGQYEQDRVCQPASAASVFLRLLNPYLTVPALTEQDYNATDHIFDP